jgi:predicted nuclease of restriction endonuclease-like (RecB) superfamily
LASSTPSRDFFNDIKELLSNARSQAIKQVNQVMVVTYFEIGRRIVEEEQGGKERAEYGKGLLKELSKALTEEFGKGFSVDNLQNMRTFYTVYSKYETVSSNSEIQKGQITSELSSKPKPETLSRIFKLSWSHYLKLMRIEDENERKFYEIESINNSWSLRELKRQYDSGLYPRLALSRDKGGVKQLAEKGQLLEVPKDTVKDPYILEFLGLPENTVYSESELEQKIIDGLEEFLLELGKGFTFVGRQVRFTFDEKHFRVDLVFYNRILQCFVLIDLKIGEITHQDLGQMQMYVNYYDRFVKLEHENKTIGIVLCQDKNETLVEITLPENNEQIFASKYQTVLPTKEELEHLLNSKRS